MEISDDDEIHCLQEILVFDNMLVYNAITIYWTMVISLHTLAINLLHRTAQSHQQKKIYLHSDHSHIISNHRRRLMTYAHAVIRTIPYATDAANSAAAPFALTTAFRLTLQVLDREIAFRTTGDAGEGNDSAAVLQECQKLRALALRYLEWTVREKIPI
jgi:glycerophosphoryl diester phosphodiesterase